MICVRWFLPGLPFPWLNLTLFAPRPFPSLFVDCYCVVGCLPRLIPGFYVDSGLLRLRVYILPRWLFGWFIEHSFTCVALVVPLPHPQQFALLFDVAVGQFTLFAVVPQVWRLQPADSRLFICTLVPLLVILPRWLRCCCYFLVVVTLILALRLLDGCVVAYTVDSPLTFARVVVVPLPPRLPGSFEHRIVVFVLIRSCCVDYPRYRWLLVDVAYSWFARSCIFTHLPVARCPRFTLRWIAGGSHVTTIIPTLPCVGLLLLLVIVGYYFTPPPALLIYAVPGCDYLLLLLLHLLVGHVVILWFRYVGWRWLFGWFNFTFVDLLWLRWLVDLVVVLLLLCTLILLPHLGLDITFYVCCVRSIPHYPRLRCYLVIVDCLPPLLPVACPHTRIYNVVDCCII